MNLYQSCQGNSVFFSHVKASYPMPVQCKAQSDSFWILKIKQINSATVTLGFS